MGRTVDPLGPLRRLSEQRLGVRSVGEIEAGLRTTQRYDAPPARALVTVALGPYFREDLGASGDATYNLRLPAPSSASVYAATGTGLDLTMVNAGRVVGAALWSGSVVTAGTATVGVVVAGGSAQYLTDAQLSAALPRGTQVIVPWGAGIPFAAGETLRPVVRTAGTFAPTTADVGVLLYIAYEAVS